MKATDSHSWSSWWHTTIILSVYAKSFLSSILCILVHFPYHCEARPWSECRVVSVLGDESEFNTCSCEAEHECQIKTAESTVWGSSLGFLPLPLHCCSNYWISISVWLSSPIWWTQPPLLEMIYIYILSEGHIRN